MLRQARIRFLLALSSLVVLATGSLTLLPDPSVLADPGKTSPALLTRWQRVPMPTIPSPLPGLFFPRKSSRVSPRQFAAITVPDHSGSSAIVHTVQPGESRATIAYRYLPRTMFLTTVELEAAIREANPTLTGTHLHPGQQVIVPGIQTAPVVDRPAPVAKDAEIRAIYLTGWTAGSARGLSIIRRWKELGGNAVCFDVKDMDGLVNVPFDHPLAPQGHRPPIRSLPKFVRFLRSLGLHAIVRIALFRDEHIAKQHPELAVQSHHTQAPWRENGKQVWADPSRREVQDYNIALAKHAAAAGVDEIQFDYVRFPAEGDQKDAEFSFEAEHPDWKRSTVINGFLKRAYEELRPTGVLLSLDVFGVMAWERSVDLARTGQNIAEMVRHCDVLSPMIYPSHFFGMDGFERPGDAPEHFVASSMERFREVTAGSGVILRPWLQAFGWRTKTYSVDYVLTQVSIARQKGGVGYLFWNANNDYSKPFAAMPALMKLAQQAKIKQDEAPEPAAITASTQETTPASPGASGTESSAPTSEVPRSGAGSDF